MKHSSDNLRQSTARHHKLTRMPATRSEALARGMTAGRRVRHGLKGGAIGSSCIFLYRAGRVAEIVQLTNENHYFQLHEQK